MRNNTPDIIFKTRVWDKTIKGEYPHKWMDNTTENILKDLKQI